ncbi:MAG TPA: N-acetylmuramoyl-L-alanine amidase [Candidatus Limnocylindrales bacterium]|nr:N-acetylmuramoyl-L-alanine amidase [Candidatus Limnocylindrales bacterium]
MSTQPARRPSAARRFAVRALAGLTLAALAAPIAPIVRQAIDHGVDTKSGAVAISLASDQLVRLPIAASHVSLHWTGSPDAHLILNVGRTPEQMSEDIAIGADDDAAPWADPTTVNYSEVVWADGARWARIRTDTPIEQLTVVAMDTDDARGIDQSGVVDAAVNQPAVITRAGWGANEDYSHNSGGYERFAQQYAPLQKLIVHHTAGRNNDPNPTATIRAIYYDHAVIRGYGDIDYNFLIDAQGHVYEGRRSREYADGESPTGEDLQGNVVRGSHARDYNDGTMGVVLLGNFTSVMPTTAARNALVNLLAWKAERHGIDPKGASTYTNPMLGNSKYLYNISGHRNVNNTACPGELFYNTFPQLRQDVANKIASTSGANDKTPPTVLSLTPLVPNPTGAHTIPFGLIFSEPVTGLAKGDFTVSGSSPGWSVDSITGTASTYTVNVKADESGDGPAEGSVKLTLPADAIADKAAHAGPADDVTATAHFAVDETPATAILYAVNTSTAPLGTSFGVSVLFDEPVARFEPTDVTIGGTSNAKTPWTVERIYGEGVTWNFTVDRQDEHPADGTLTIQFAEGMTVDLAGVASAKSNTITRVIDHSAPTSTAPRANLRAGTTLNGGAERVRLTWTGSDVGPAGLKSYEIARSYDGAAFKSIGTSTAGQFDWSMTPGHTYRFRVRATDKSGNVGAWATGPVVKAALTQQTSSALHWSGSSTTTSYSKYSGGSERYLRAAGASVSYTTTARSLSFVTTRSPSRGRADIWIDGVKVATVDLSTPDTVYQWVAYSKTWSSSGTHTIKVVSVGSPVPRVDIDAFGVIR